VYKKIYIIKKSIDIYSASKPYSISYFSSKNSVCTHAQEIIAAVTQPRIPFRKKPCTEPYFNVGNVYQNAFKNQKHLSKLEDEIDVLVIELQEYKNPFNSWYL
jgi:hypothetical protein